MAPNSFHMSAGANLVSEDSKGRQCAHLAAMRNKKKILQLLFDHGVDLDCRCEAGKTPIHYAAQHGGLYTKSRYHITRITNK